MKVLITISKENIRNGERACPYRCPTALALADKVKTTRGLLVGSSAIYFNSRTSFRMGKKLPEKIIRWIAKFDERGRNKPIKFYIDIPKKYLKKK